MARFPEIDSPCPLGIDEQRRIDGYCSRCEKPVHDLTLLGDDQRVAFMRAARGPVCVSYRTARPVTRASAGLGAALAISVLASTPPAAIEPLPTGSETSAAQQSVEAARPSPIATAQTPAKPKCADAVAGEPGQESASESAPADWRVITVGGVRDPAAASWVDDGTLPELPMRSGEEADAMLASAEPKR